MRVVVHNEYDVTCCGNCPYAQAEATFDSYDEDHYRCAAHPDQKYIACFVFLKSDLKTIPEWCPFRKDKVNETLD